MTFQDLVHATRMLKSLIALVILCLRGPGTTLSAAAASVGCFVIPYSRGPLVLPGTRIIAAIGLVPTREDAIEILGILEIFADDMREVCEREDVVAEHLVIREYVTDQSSKEKQVGTGT